MLFASGRLTKLVPNGGHFPGNSALLLAQGIGEKCRFAEKKTHFR